MSIVSSPFGRSPIRPMQQHMKAAVTCAREVLPLAEAMAAGETAAIASHRAEISRLEHEAARIEERINAVKREESETDAVAERCLRTLFEIEDELGRGALSWYRVIQ